MVSFDRKGFRFPWMDFLPTTDWTLDPLIAGQMAERTTDHYELIFAHQQHSIVSCSIASSGQAKINDGVNGFLLVTYWHVEATLEIWGM